jgi:hypothetical protein
MVMRRTMQTRFNAAPNDDAALEPVLLFLLILLVLLILVLLLLVLLLLVLLLLLSGGCDGKC